MKKLIVFIMVLAITGMAQAELVNNPEGWETNPTFANFGTWGGATMTWGWSSGTWVGTNVVQSTGGNPSAYGELSLNNSVIVTNGFFVAFLIFFSKLKIISSFS